MRSRITLDCAALGPTTALEALVREELSTPTSARVVVVSDAPLALDEALGQDASLAFQVESEPERRFALVVTAVEALRSDADDLMYAVELRHETALLGFRNDTRMFLDKTTKDIVTAVLGDAKLAPPKWSTQRAFPSRETCLQYRETDLQFVSRLLADEGVWWWSCDDEAAIRLGDGPTAVAPVEGHGGHVPFSAEGRGLGVRTFELEHSVTSDAVTLTDWDFKKPGLDLRSRCFVGEERASERFEYPGGFVLQSEGAALAKIRAEEIASGKLVGRGASVRPDLRAGAWFELTATFVTPIARRYLLRAVTHRMSEGEYTNEFVCSPLDLPYRPRRPPRPLVDGAHSATVAGPAGEEIHTDVHGRMKAKLAFDRGPTRDDKASPWMRVSQPALAGSMTLARVGWEMAVRYLDGHPDRPIAVARLYDGTHPPPESLPGAKAKSSFQTLSSPRAAKLNALTMDDAGGAMRVSLLAAKDLDGTVNNDRTQTIGKDDTLAVDVDTTTMLGGRQTVTVDLDRSTTIAKDAGVAVAGDREKAVTANESATIEGSASVKVKGDETEKVGGSRKCVAKKQITETTEGAFTRTVGGASTSHAGDDHELYVAGNATETVGGAKSVTSSDGSISELVGGNLSVTVGGACIHTVSGHRTAATKGTSTIKVGAAAVLTATGSLQIKAEKINVTVGGAANIVAGGGVLTLTPASASLVGVITIKGSGGVEIAGNPQLVG